MLRREPTVSPQCAGQGTLGSSPPASCFIFEKVRPRDLMTPDLSHLSLIFSAVPSSQHLDKNGAAKGEAGRNTLHAIALTLRSYWCWPQLPLSETLFPHQLCLVHSCPPLPGSAQGSVLRPQPPPNPLSPQWSWAPSSGLPQEFTLKAVLTYLRFSAYHLLPPL